MNKVSFTYSLTGKEGLKDHSFIRIEHEPPFQATLTLALADSIRPAKRSKGVAAAFALGAINNRVVKVYRWDFQDAVLIESDRLDTALGVDLVAQLERDGVVAQGSAVKFTESLRRNGFLQDHPVAKGTDPYVGRKTAVFEHKNEGQQKAYTFTFTVSGHPGEDTYSYIRIDHGSILKSQITLALSDALSPAMRTAARELISAIGETERKRVNVYRGKSHDAIVIRSDRFDLLLATRILSRLERAAIVPRGITWDFKTSFAANGPAEVDLSEPAPSSVPNANDYLLPFTIPSSIEEESGNTPRDEFR